MVRYATAPPLENPATPVYAFSIATLYMLCPGAVAANCRVHVAPQLMVRMMIPAPLPLPGDADA